MAAGRYNLALLRRVDLEAQAESPTGGGFPPDFLRTDLTELGHRIVAFSAGSPSGTRCWQTPGGVKVYSWLEIAAHRMHAEAAHREDNAISRSFHE